MGIPADMFGIQRRAGGRGKAHAHRNKTAVKVGVRLNEHTRRQELQNTQNEPEIDRAYTHLITHLLLLCYGSLRAQANGGGGGSRLFRGVYLKKNEKKNTISPRLGRRSGTDSAGPSRFEK